MISFISDFLENSSQDDFFSLNVNILSQPCQYFRRFRSKIFYIDHTSDDFITRNEI
jgi:hypothetical protein